ncbi:unnamed protein product, partial [Allacma fusca]
FRELYRRY